MTEVTGRARMRVTLAECGGQFWLVEGEDHLDALLAGQLPPEVAVEIVNCRTRAELFALWEELSGETGEANQPWTLNPRLMVGLLGRLGLSQGAVQFTTWSAAMDDAAAAAITGSAAWLGANGGGALVLRQFVPASAPPGLVDLQRLRAQLVRAALERAGVDTAAMRDESVPLNDPAQAEQLLIVTVPPVS